MKTREIVLFSLLLLGGAAVVAVGWRLLGPQQSATANANPASTPQQKDSAAAKSQKSDAEQKATPAKKSQTGAAKAASEGSLPFDEAVKLALTDPDRGSRYKSL